jgi:DNA polymerase-4
MILHIDMDAFYASVEQLDHPEYKGKCVIVGGQSNRSVVSAASYEARKFGVHSAMPMFQARQKCSGGIIVAPRMARYKEISRIIMNLLKEFTPLLEVVSIDEAYMDLSGSDKLHGDPVDIGTEIKNKILSAVNLTCSVGIAPNKFLAKIASDMNKPDGLTIIQESEVESFVQPLAIRKVPGVGEKTAAQLSRMGVKTLGDVHKFSEEALIKRLGKFGRRLKQLSLGIDTSAVQPDSRHKSISSERTLSADTSDLNKLKVFLLKQSETVAAGLRKEGLRAKTITLKMKTADFKIFTRSRTLNAPTRSSENIYLEAEKLLASFNLTPKVRLIGVGASGLISASVPVQMDLFSQNSAATQTWERVDQTLDSIQQKFGKDAIRRASLKEKISLAEREQNEEPS